MPASSAFNTKGALPKLPSINTLSFPTLAKSGPSSASQNANLQGADYYNNLAKNGTPQEKVAAQSWLSRQAQPVAPKLGTNPGMIQPKPTTPVKSITSTDGTKTEYHAPVAEKVATPAPVVKTEQVKAPTPGFIPQPTPIPDPYAAPAAGTTIGGQIQNVSQAGVLTPNEIATQARLIQQSREASPEYLAQVAEANRIAEERRRLAEEFAQKDQNINRTAGFLTQASGLEGQLQKQYDMGQAALSAQEQSAASRIAAANAQQGLQLQAGESAYSGAQNQAARGLNAQSTILGAVAPVTGVPYGTQTIDPTTGLPMGSTGGVSVDPNNPASSIPSLSQAVVNGQMTIDQANAALGNNIGLTTNLRNQILQNNPNFNFVQSSSSAQTQATGQQLKSNVDSANKALDTLTASFYSLPGIQTGGIPLTNNIAQWIGSNLGQGALSQYNTNLHDARSQLVGVLNSSGGTPTGNEATAQSYLPDNMTKAQFDANVGTPEKPGIVRELMNQKLTSFAGSGAQTGASNGSSGGTTITTPSGLTINPNF